MKRKITLICILILSFFTVSKAQIGIGFFGGMSSPNNEMNNIFNTSTYNNMVVERESTKGGFHVGAKIRLPLIVDLTFTGSVSWNRFPESQLKIKNPVSGNIVATVNTTQNIIPIAAGFNYYFIKIPPVLSIIGIYGTGELQYSFISNSTDVSGMPISEPSTDKRIGVGVGLGVDVDLKLLLMNVEAKYNLSNLIGKQSDESLKNYLTLSTSLFFGSAGAK